MEENLTNKPRSFTYMSDTIGEIALALSEFQGNLEQPKLEKEVKVKTKTGGGYSFKYADLYACVKAATPGLKANGLSVCQLVSEGKLITILAHKSGEWIKSELYLPAQSNDYQSYGGAITYLKRYSYCAILGIVADTDDDANMASGNQVTSLGASNNLSSVMYTGEQLKEAIADMETVQDDAYFQVIWNKWTSVCPALGKTGSEFYNFCANKRKQLAEAKLKK